MWGARQAGAGGVRPETIAIGHGEGAGGCVHGGWSGGAPVNTCGVELAHFFEAQGPRALRCCCSAPRAPRPMLHAARRRCPRAAASHPMTLSPARAPSAPSRRSKCVHWGAATFAPWHQETRSPRLRSDARAPHKVSTPLVCPPPARPTHARARWWAPGSATCACAASQCSAHGTPARTMRRASPRVRYSRGSCHLGL